MVFLHITLRQNISDASRRTFCKYSLLINETIVSALNPVKLSIDLKQDLHCLIAALYSTFISSPRKRICLQLFSPLKQLLLSSLISHQILINKLFHLFFIPVKTIRCRQNRILLAICIIHFLYKHFLNSKKCLLLRHFLKKSTNSFLHIREHLKQCLRRLQRTFQNLIVLFF